jgi:hypothetical protein
MKRATGFTWVFVALVLTIFLSAIIYTRSSRRGEDRAKIVALMSEVSKHPTNQEVRRLLSESRFQGLTFSQESNELVVETPIEFGAKNWVLYKEVNDSRVISLRVRTADSVKEHPVGAPPDKSLQN